MNGKHSGNGVVKSTNRQGNLKSYRNEARREKNRDRRLRRIMRGFRGEHRIDGTNIVRVN